MILILIGNDYYFMSFSSERKLERKESPITTEAYDYVKILACERNRSPRHIQRFKLVKIIRVRNRNMSCRYPIKLIRLSWRRPVVMSYGDIDKKCE